VQAATALREDQDRVLKGRHPIWHYPQRHFNFLGHTFGSRAKSISERLCTYVRDKWPSNEGAKSALLCC